MSDGKTVCNQNIKHSKLHLSFKIKQILILLRLLYNIINLEDFKDLWDIWNQNISLYSINLKYIFIGKIFITHSKVKLEIIYILKQIIQINIKCEKIKCFNYFYAKTSLLTALETLSIQYLPSTRSMLYILSTRQNNIA